MDFLRRIFGLNEAPTTTGSSAASPAEELDEMEMRGETAPIAETLEKEQQGPPNSFGSTRQLPPLESALTRPSQHITYGQSTDVGMVRGNNQDSVLTFFASHAKPNSQPDFGLFIVADGMGGHHDGEKASAIATRVVAEEVTTHIYLPMLAEQEHEQEQNLEAEKPTIIEILMNAVKKANDVVVDSVPEGGTTITAAAVIGNLAYMVHIGDSRAYLINEDQNLEQITRDHSLVQRLIELDQLTPEEAADHPQKNVLYRAIGQSDNLEVDAITRRLPTESYLLLCSDGLWNMVSEEELLEVILGSPTPQAACDQLVSMANEYGGTDNISAVLLKVPT